VERFKELYPEDIYPNGNYAPLYYGKLKYWMVGSEYSPGVVLICGIASPSLIFKDIIPILTTHFQVLVFDHYGRGYSETPETTYDAALYCAEIVGLMQHVGWKEARIIGLSMGGGIAAAFAAAYPQFVRDKVGFIAPAGLLSASQMPLSQRFLISPLMQSYLNSSLGRLYLQNDYKPGTYTSVAEEVNMLQRFTHPGYLKAIASSVRDGPLRGMEDAFEIVGQKDFSVCIIWGTADEVVPFSLATKMLSRVPKAKLVTIPGGGHDITISQPEIVGNALKEWLRS